MAIEKMVLLKIIGSLDNMHSILKELIPKCGKQQRV